MNSTNSKLNSVRQPSRMGTSLGQSERPTTASRGAGYNKNIGRNQPASQGINIAANKKQSQEQILKEVEKNVSKLLDESILLKCKNELYEAKDKCMLALGKLEDYKRKYDQKYFNSELDFGIKLNLGLIYQQMKNYDEAKAVYQEILKLEGNYVSGIQVARVRINIGNIHYGQGKYKEAIKEYQKTYDKINKDNKDLRANILKNISLAQAKLSSYSDSINNYENAISLTPDIKTCMNLLLCKLVIKETKKENLMKYFNLMLEIYFFITNKDVENKYISINTSQEKEDGIDSLKEYLTAQKKEFSNIITTVGLVLTKFIDKNEPINAYDSIITCLKNNGIKDIVNEFEMAKAMYFMKKRDIDTTISIMKSFENKDKSIVSRVSNCISFLFFIEGNMVSAEHYANLALENERYNHKALVNKGNIFYFKENYLRAKDFYLEAIGVQSDCIEAIYNLGMINEKLENYIEALQAYDKLNSVVPNIPEVLYKLGKMNEKIKDYDSALNYYNILLNQLNANNKKDQDPVLLSNIGNLYYLINPKDERNYMFYFEESYKYNPSNIDNLIILGFLNFREEIYEKAIKYFELAKKIDPYYYTAEVQYAKCYQKLGNNREAYKIFRKLNRKYPDNIEVLTYLIAISRDLNLPYDDYHRRIRELEDDMIKQGQGRPVYGQPVENQSGPNVFGFGNPIGHNPYYQGEPVNFQSKKNIQQNNIGQKGKSNYMNFQTNAEELLP